MASQQVTSQAQQALPGEYYGLPTHTNYTEQPDNNSGIVTTLAATSVAVTGMVSFRQVDVVRAWRYRQYLSNVVVTAGGTINQTSQYAPYSFLGATYLNINNLYNAIDLPYNGIDLALINAIRPIRGINYQNLRTAPSQWPYATGEINLAAKPAAANTSTSPPGAIAAPTSAASYLVEYDLPVSVDLDYYYYIDPATGNPLTYGENVSITPLNMGVTARDVTPSLTMNGVIGTTTDVTPFVETGTGAGFTSATCTHDFRRIGSYAAVASDMPFDDGWRYAVCARKYAMSAQSSVSIPLKSVINQNGGGQLLSITVRLYDPSAASGGAPIALGTAYSATSSSIIANYTLQSAQLIYGSNFVRFTDDPGLLQSRFYDQHGFNLPIGVFCWDLAYCGVGKLSNAGAINLLTTDATINLTFNAAVSSTAYAVVVTESLVYTSVPGMVAGGSR
jgi:hypothetical protein